MHSQSTPSAVDIRHLRLVAAIAANGSLTAAARTLQLTQPALSHQLRDLETRLRTPLFIRTARRMVLTPAGEQLAQVAHDVLSRIHSFERQALGGEFSEVRGTIRLATECYTCFHWLPSVLRAFRERWPAVDLRIAPEYTAAPTNALRDGTLDLAIVHTQSADKRLRFQPLFDDELVVVMAPDHRLARRPFISAQDFAPEHLIVYSTADGTTTLVRDVLEPAGVVPERFTRIQLTEAILELVMAGLGIAVFSRWAVLPAIRAGSIHAARLTENGFSRKWFAATRASDVTTGYQDDLIQLLRRHVSGGPQLKETQRIA